MTIQLKSLIDKNDFIGLNECTWLYCGAESPPHRGALAELQRYMENRSKGPRGRDRNAEVEQECKANIAALMNGRPEQIAFLSNSSEIISTLALSLGLKAGDNVVINTLEFPSGVLPWIALKKNGIEVRVVEHDRWQIGVEDIIACVDSNTKLVITSHVSYISGASIDYKMLYSQLKKTNALLLLDVTQSLGVIPVDMNEADFVVCSSYKWLLSFHGVGILGINPARTKHIESCLVGWRSISDMFSPNRFDRFHRTEDASGFELGYPSYPTLYALNFTSKLLLQIGPQNIQNHVIALGELMIEGLKSLDYEIMTPTDSARRAGNISVVCADGERVAEELLRHQIYVWGGDGRIRASLHLFNDAADVEMYIHHLSQLQTQPLGG